MHTLGPLRFVVLCRECAKHASKNHHAEYIQDRLTLGGVTEGVAANFCKVQRPGPNAYNSMPHWLTSSFLRIVLDCTDFSGQQKAVAGVEGIVWCECLLVPQLGLAVRSGGKGSCTVVQV